MRKISCRFLAQNLMHLFFIDRMRIKLSASLIDFRFGTSYLLNMTTQPMLEMLIGKSVSHVWTDCSALFIELGKLSEGKLHRNGVKGNPSGEITIFAGYCWRIERIRSVVAGSNCSSRQRNAISKELQNTIVDDVQISSRIPELQIKFSNGLWLVTFNPDSAQPDWSIGFNTLGRKYLSVARGKLQIGKRRDGQDCRQ